MATVPTHEQISALPAQVAARVEPGQIDHNGHMNIRHYFALGDQTLLARWEQLGIGADYIPRTGMSTITAEHHLRYYAELRLGDEYTAHTRLVARSAKSLHVIVLLADATNRRLACTFEAMILNIDLDTRRVAPFPAEVSAALDEAIAADNGVDWAAPVSGSMAVRPG